MFYAFHTNVTKLSDFSRAFLIEPIVHVEIEGVGSVQKTPLAIRSIPACRYQLAGIVFHFPRVYWLPFLPPASSWATLKRRFSADLLTLSRVTLVLCRTRKKCGSNPPSYTMEHNARVPQKAAHCDTKLSHSTNGGLETCALSEIQKILLYNLKSVLIKYCSL